VHTGAIIMGFGGGGGGALPNHEHTNIVLDGGPLDFANTTVASLATGSICYSSGVALQELTVGGANTVLQIAAGLPSWQTLPLASSVLTTAGDLLEMDNTPSLARIPAGNLNDVLTMGATLPQWSPVTSSSVYELIDYTRVGASTTTIDTTFTNIPGDDLTELYCISSGCNGGFDIDVQIYDEGGNLLTNADYTNHGYTISSGVQTIINTSGDTEWNVVPGTFEPHYAIMHITLGRCGGPGLPYFPRMQSFSSGTNGVSHIGGVYDNATKATGIAGVKFGISASNSIENGTYLAIYQVKTA